MFVHTCKNSEIALPQQTPIDTKAYSKASMFHFHAPWLINYATLQSRKKVDKFTKGFTTSLSSKWARAITFASLTVRLGIGAYLSTRACYIRRLIFGSLWWLCFTKFSSPTISWTILSKSTPSMGFSTTECSSAWSMPLQPWTFSRGWWSRMDLSS